MSVQNCSCTMKRSIFQSFLFVVVFYRSLCAVESTPEEDNAFEKFLLAALSNYSNWLASNNLDPSPVIPDVVDLSYQDGSYANISAFVTNQKMFNHSIVTNLQARALLDEIEFRVGIDMLEYSVIGEYTVEANISDTLVFASGESKFTAVPRFLFNPAVYIFIRNYWVNQEGYVSIRNADIRTIYSDSFIGTFPELGASLAEKVTGAYLEIVFPTRLNDWCPLDKYVLTYLQEVLDETTYADIISGGR